MSSDLANLFGASGRSCDCGEIGGHPVCQYCLDAVKKLLELMHEFTVCGIEMQDDRIDYVTMQVPKTLLQEASALLAEEEK